MHTSTSADGTTIAYDRKATATRWSWSPARSVTAAIPGQVKLAELLSARFTVYSYDRRGRGDSGDTKPYAIEREIEDLAAVIGAAGGDAHVWGLSSGAVLALEAAAAGLPIRKLAVQEPPLGVDPADRRPPSDLLQQRHRADRAGPARRGGPVLHGGRHGRAAFVPTLLRLMPGCLEDAHGRRAHPAVRRRAHARLPGGTPAAARPVGGGHHADAGHVRRKQGDSGLLRHAPAAVAAALPAARSSNAAASATPRRSTPPHRRHPDRIHRQRRARGYLTWRPS